MVLEWMAACGAQRSTLWRSPPGSSAHVKVVKASISDITHPKGVWVHWDVFAFAAKPTTSFQLFVMADIHGK